MQLNLDFHNHTILVKSSVESILQSLKDEFHFFARESVARIDWSLSIKNEVLPPISPVVAHKITETCAIYNLGSKKILDYFSKAQVIWDDLDKTIEIFAQDEDRLYELGFLAIHSLIGQKLDQDGLCRIHALGISVKNKNALVMLPSKGGKSTLLSHLMANSEVNIISDDMPLINMKGEVYPFPTKISLEEIPRTGALSQLKWREFKRTQYPSKFTASLAQFKDRIDINSPHNETSLIAGFRLSSGKSILTPVSRFKMIKPLFEHMIVGVGLPQVIEMFLSFNFTDFIKMAYHASIRFICATKLLFASKCFHFYLGPDLADNAQILLEQLNEHKPT